MGQRLFGDDRRLFAVQRKDRCPGLFSHDLQLVDGGRAVDIAGHQHGAAALLDEVFGQLGGVGRFTIALQAAEHNDGLALVLDDQLRGFLAAHQAISSSLTILTTCWAGVRLSMTSCPIARSETLAQNSFATL